MKSKHPDIGLPSGFLLHDGMRTTVHTLVVKNPPIKETECIFCEEILAEWVFESDIFIFAFFMEDFKSVHIVGFLPAEEFFFKSKTMEKGERCEHGILQYDSRIIKVRDLRPPEGLPGYCGPLQ